MKIYHIKFENNLPNIILICSQGYLQQFSLTVPEDISENFGKSHHCKKPKFENFSESQLTHLGELQGFLMKPSRQ